MLDFSELPGPRRDLLVSVVRSALFVALHHYDPATLSQANQRLIPAWRRLYGKIEVNALTSLDKDDSAACLEAVHLTQYGLGPFELHTITGHGIREFASTGFLLFDQQMEVYKGVLWTEDENTL